MISGSSVAWGILWVFLALTVVAMILLIVTTVCVTVSTTVRWVEFRPGEIRPRS